MNSRVDTISSIPTPEPPSDSWIRRHGKEVGMFLTESRRYLAVGAAAMYLAIPPERRGVGTNILNAIIGATDVLDGQVTKRTGNTSPEGAERDEKADKFAQHSRRMALYASSKIRGTNEIGLLSVITPAIRDVVVERSRDLYAVLMKPYRDKAEGDGVDVRPSHKSENPGRIKTAIMEIAFQASSDPEAVRDGTSRRLHALGTAASLYSGIYAIGKLEQEYVRTFDVASADKLSTLEHAGNAIYRLYVHEAERGQNKYRMSDHSYLELPFRIHTENP